jgi:hypothetical protein
MGLFFDVLSAINNPAQQGSVSQLEALTGTLQQAANENGIASSQLPAIVSALGTAMGPILKQQQGMAGEAGLAQMMTQAVGAAGGAGALQALFPPQVQAQLAQGVAQRTGLDPSILQSLLPTLLPVVLGMLNMGASQPGQQGSNPLLSAFLDADRDGDTDLGDVFNFATRFIK